MFGSRRALRYPAKVYGVTTGNASAPESTLAGVVALQIATNNTCIIAATGTSIEGAKVVVATSTFK